MITVIVKRNTEPTVIQLTEENIMRELESIPGCELLLEESWAVGLKRVRTQFVCLVEADHVMSPGFLALNFERLMRGTRTNAKKGGGYTKLAMLSSKIGIKRFDHCIYNYEFHEPRWDIHPVLNHQHEELYPVQIGFVPGSLIRMSAIKGANLPWDDPNLIAMSAAVSLHFWATNRRVELNPETTYVSNQNYLEQPINSKYHIPSGVKLIFEREGL